MFVPMPKPIPSPEARYLSDSIARAVQEYRASHPELSEQDVAAAFDLARDQVREVGDAALAKTKAMIAVMIGLVVLGAGLALYLVQSGDGGVPVSMIAPAVAIVAGFVVVVLRAAKSPTNAPKSFIALAIGLLLAAVLGALLFIRSGPGVLSP